jgi:hypothetical protein
MEGSCDMRKLNSWLSKLLQERGPDLFRSKGILSVVGSDDRWAALAGGPCRLPRVSIYLPVVGWPCLAWLALPGRWPPDWAAAPAAAAQLLAIRRGRAPLLQALWLRRKRAEADQPWHGARTLPPTNPTPTPTYTHTLQARLPGRAHAAAVSQQLGGCRPAMGR